ncbi:ribonuclease domain-containing protein [Streptomyces sp. NPDC005648]|uniref:ribonuclease domain-containing protein n=1 Tax=Streptomyces sp. NPDC005648 TaxID=3157044 RepID=UPI00339FD5E7
MVLRFVPRLLLCLLVLVVGCSATDSGPGSGRTDGMATVRVSRLPAEARRTLALIDEGGPFPYARDGVVFGNFEGLLPRHERGYYHEYTVPTPGSRDRGARRIVTGQAGEIYYTDDHYNSFRAVLR